MPQNRVLSLPVTQGDRGLNPEKPSYNENLLTGLKLKYDSCAPNHYFNCAKRGVGCRYEPPSTSVIVLKNLV
jgi:hypothetical protein